MPDAHKLDAARLYEIEVAFAHTGTLGRSSYELIIAAARDGLRDRALIEDQTAWCIAECDAYRKDSVRAEMCAAFRLTRNGHGPCPNCPRHDMIEVPAVTQAEGAP